MAVALALILVAALEVEVVITERLAALAYPVRGIMVVLARLARQIIVVAGVAVLGLSAKLQQQPFPAVVVLG
jgi:hypothetical protein